MIKKMILKLALLILVSIPVSLIISSGALAHNNLNLGSYSAVVNSGIQPPDSLPKTSAGSDQLKTVLQIVFGIAGAISVLMITIAGYSYIISSGDPQKTAKAKDTILYAVIGLVISILSFSIVSFIIGKV